MTDNSSGAKSPLFKPAAGGGWIFRAPKLFGGGEAPHYLVDDAQKDRIDAILRPRRPLLVLTFFVLAIVGWAAVAATLVWALGWVHDKLTTGDNLLIIFLTVVSIALGLLVALYVNLSIQRRRLEPVLKEARPTSERISMAEVGENLKKATTLRQSLVICVVSTVASLAGVMNILLRVSARHGLSDVQIYVWAFVAIVFGFQAVRAFRAVIEKAGER